MAGPVRLPATATWRRAPRRRDDRRHLRRPLPRAGPVTVHHDRGGHRDACARTDHRAAGMDRPARGGADGQRLPVRGLAGHVRVGVTATAGRVSLTVEDSGPGIPEEEQKRLFDRFHRAVDDGQGAGLGLAIADSIVRSTGGRWNIGSSQALGGARMEVSWHPHQPRHLPAPAGRPWYLRVRPGRRWQTSADAGPEQVPYCQKQALRRHHSTVRRPFRVSPPGRFGSRR